MDRKFIMGNEAIGLGAIHAGVRLVSGYPGTPSTEVLEAVAKNNPGHIHVEWSANEKAALEVAAGGAYTGARTMVTMKQVGLNVASDPLMSLSYVGVKGGMVVMVADDPGPISSQTEQDTRTFASYSKLPVFDPSSPEEAYEMIGDAFTYSEKYQTPVIFRPTTRICHGCSSVSLKEYEKSPEPEGFIKDSSRWVIFPRLSYQNHLNIENNRLPGLARDFSSYRFNLLKGRGSKGIITGGVSYEYVCEALNGYDEVKLFKVATPHPFPVKLALQFLEGLTEVIAIEELDPVLEKELLLLCGIYHLPVKVRGKLTQDMPAAGENSVEAILKKLYQFLDVPDGILLPQVPMKSQEFAPVPDLPVRPPVLCAGCSHRASFYAVKRAMEGRKAVFCGDIGCYTLGNAKPLDMVDTCLCMGAGITVAQGLDKIEPDKTYFAFAGDSTFFASGIMGIVNAVYNQANLIVAILDNSTTAMTGHQPHPGTGKTVMGQVVDKIDITKVLEGIGVKKVVTVNPLQLQESIDVIHQMAKIKGVKAIIFKYPCAALSKKPENVCRILEEKCVKCQECIKEIGCPALSSLNGDVMIDEKLCTGCGLCMQVCSIEAIELFKLD